MRSRNLITISLREDQIDALLWFYSEESPSKALKKLINSQMPFIIAKMNSELKWTENLVMNWIKKKCEENQYMIGKNPNILQWMLENCKDFNEEFEKARENYEKEQKIQKDVI